MTFERARPIRFARHQHGEQVVDVSHGHANGVDFGELAAMRIGGYQLPQRVEGRALPIVQVILTMF